MRFRFLLGVPYAPNPFGAYRTPIDYRLAVPLLKSRYRGSNAYFTEFSFQPKEKQAEMRKHIQQRKRKSLSDLFKMLSSLGMMAIASYTTNN